MSLDRSQPPQPFVETKRNGIAACLENKCPKGLEDHTHPVSANYENKTMNTLRQQSQAKRPILMRDGVVGNVLGFEPRVARSYLAPSSIRHTLPGGLQTGIRGSGVTVAPGPVKTPVPGQSRTLTPIFRERSLNSDITSGRGQIVTAHDFQSCDSGGRTRLPDHFSDYRDTLRWRSLPAAIFCVFRLMVGPPSPKWLTSVQLAQDASGSEDKQHDHRTVYAEVARAALVRTVF